MTLAPRAPALSGTAFCCDRRGGAGAADGKAALDGKTKNFGEEESI